METLQQTPEQEAFHDFSVKMQQALVAEAQANNQPITESVPALLGEHGISHDVIHPLAVPDRYALGRITDADWQDIAASPEPFVTLWSRSNRRAIEDRNRSRYADHSSLNIAPRPSTPMEQFNDMADEAFQGALPAVHSTSVDTLTKAHANGGFASNRAVLEPQGGYDVTKAAAGHTYEADREAGLDNFVFADYARPHTERLGDSQAEVVVVFKPEAMQQEGTIVTSMDYMDTLRLDDSPNNAVGSGGVSSDYSPSRYMRTLKTSEDFRKVVDIEADQMTGAQGSYQNGVFIPHKLSVEQIARGADGQFDQTGEAHFSTWEVKIPSVSYDNVDRLIFRDEAARSRYMEQNPGDTTPYVVEPDIQKALARGDDVFGTGERVQTAMDEKIAENYAVRRAVVDAADPSTLTVEYKTLDSPINPAFNPDWLHDEKFDSAEQAVKQVQTRRKVGNALMSMFADEDEEIAELVQDEPIRIARIVRAGDAAVIEEVVEH